MPSRKKNKRVKNYHIKKNHPNNAIYNANSSLYIDTDREQELKHFCNDIIIKHQERFGDCVLDNLLDDEKVKILHDRYQFCRSQLPNHIDTTNAMHVAKNNAVCAMMDSVRNVAKLNNIEKELSISITQSSALPMYSTLMKHNLDAFQYIDEINNLQDQYEELSASCPNFLLIEQIHPKVIIRDYDQYNELRDLVSMYCLTNESIETGNGPKIMQYLINFENTFTPEFCTDIRASMYPGI